jgi:hypothetical protein
MGALDNPSIDPIADAVKFEATDVADLLEFLKALEGEGWQRYRAP